MPPKRRILVSYEGEGRKRLKLAVAVDEKATIDTLAREIAESVGEEAVRLEIGDGFELRRRDDVDIILDSDVVLARPLQGELNAETQPGLTGLERHDLDPMQQTDNGVEMEVDQKPCRYKIRLVTAEIARTHAKRTLKDSTEQSIGVLAFNGEFVSGYTTISDLRHEAAEIFGWVSHGEDFVDSPCCHRQGTTCSCAIAHDVDLHGLSSTLHCRFSIDGSKCNHKDCSYSHAPLSSNGHLELFPPHCSVCDDALAFPCPSCLKKAEADGIQPDAAVHCAIVKNAGCGHLHHAHCLGSRVGPWTTCPSGCPSSTTQREAVPFDQEIPSITLVWDGDKIDEVPIPSNLRPTAGLMLHLSTQTVIELVGAFLRSRLVDLSELSLRIHARDPQTETVRFTWSTIVSVCSKGAHSNEGHRRFMFPGFTSHPSYSTLSKGKFREEKTKAKSFEIDFHTSSYPIMVCGCARFEEVFLRTENPSEDVILSLYAVKRLCVTTEVPVSKHDTCPVSKQSAFHLDAAWQPSTLQSQRGMAALLSSLLVLSQMVSKKGVESENKILAALDWCTRFPPAVRTLALLLLNVAPQPEEKAALSEALFQALGDFNYSAPPVFTLNRTRRFETVRILLGHLLNITDVLNSTVARPLKSISLLCALSHKRLVDPVTLDPYGVVERSSGSLYSVGGALYRPNYGASGQHRTLELADSDGQLRVLLVQGKEFNGSEIFILRSHEIGTVNHSVNLEGAGRDFSNAIRRANETDLISRGPLELKSTSVVPPQIVLDREGFLAVFTGRGCGSTRDVNFYQPTAGGDTEVDVNDVEYALQKVIPERKFEDSWEVDCFGGIPAKARTPDEAIVLCLDLSSSMNDHSAVEAGVRERFDHESEGRKAVDDEVKGFTDDVILQQAKEWITEQHESCHEAWKNLIEDDELTATELIRHLGLIAQRHVLANQDEESVKPTKFACFASASKSQKASLAQFVQGFLQSYQPSPTLGKAPFDVPREFVDPTTGEFMDIEDLESCNQSARSRWVSGEDILDGLDSNSQLEKLTVKLLYGRLFSWKLPLATPTRTLYSLVNRVTEAEFSFFSLRSTSSGEDVHDSETLPLSSIGLVDGEILEIHDSDPHSREPLVFEVRVDDSDICQTIIVPDNASALALLSRARGPENTLLSDIRLWHSLTDTGDGHRYGTLVHLDSEIIDFFPLELECDKWAWLAVGSQRNRFESRNLKRLHLMKELFNIFLNRVSSFDTSVSLVLGLVTFADKAYIKQEPTPIFENFRLQLDKVEARGDTAMYEALDLARSSLVNFRRDLPGLRRRIIIVSDGENTSAGVNPFEVGRALQRDRIIVDSVQVGERFSRSLWLFSAATGGYRFFPRTSLADALSIFDLETMMNSAERPVRDQFKRAFEYGSQELFTASSLPLFPIDVVTIDQFPERVQHPKLIEGVRDVRRATRNADALNNHRTKRIMRELRELISDPHPQIDVYVNDEDISFLKVVIEAPSDIEKCPYKGGCFLLTCDLPAEYPRSPPEIRFVTFVLHPNVSKQGKVCVAELSRLWSSDITLKEIFSLVYGLLLEPDLDNPLEIQASLKYYDDDGTFALAAAKAVATHATKSRSEWRKELDV